MNNLTVTGQAANPANPTNIKDEPTQENTIGFAIAIIIGIGGLVVAGVGVGGCLGAISTFNQVTSIILIATGGAGGIAFLIFGIVGTVKNQSQKKAQSGTKKTKREEKNNNPPQKTTTFKTKNKINEISKKKDLNSVNDKKKNEQKMKGTESEKNKKKEPKKVNGPEKDTLNAAEKTILFFDNQARLIDRSSGKVQIIPFKNLFPLVATDGQSHDAILLLGKMVLFTHYNGNMLFFSRAANTDRVIVEDAGQKGVYKIKEVQTHGLPENNWVVDTNKKFYITTTATNGQQKITEIYRTESEIPREFPLNKLKLCRIPITTTFYVSFDLS
jgi:hypothetical protein